MTAKSIPEFAKVFASGARSLNPLAVLENIVTSYTEYRKVRWQEKSKIRGIEAWEKVTLAEIEAKRQLFLAYMAEAFAERAKLFDELFARVDHALAADDAAHLGMVLASITYLAKTTPFLDLMDLNGTKALLRDPGHEWKL